MNQIAKALYRSANKGMVVYAAFPRSGSQYLLNLIAKCAGSRAKVLKPKLGSSYGHNFISMRKLLVNPGFRKRLILYGHFPYHRYNISMIEKFSADPMAMLSIRPLPDVVVSYKDHIDTAGFGPLDYRIEGMIEGNAAWHELDEKRKYDYIIQFIVPWYVRFIAGWVEGSKRWPTELLTFEEYTRHPWQCLVTLGKALKLEFDVAALEKLRTPETVEMKHLNVGIGGRGFESLSGEQRDQIANLFSLHGDAFLHSNLSKYLLRGYEGLPYSVEDVMAEKATKGSFPVANWYRR